MASDGFDRKPSNDPSAHRDLVVVDPPLEGRDVANLQRALRLRLAARNLDDDIAVPTHGKFTHATWLACVEVGYALGFRSDTYLKVSKGRGVCTIGSQVLIRNPDQRDSTQISRAKVRQDRVKQGPRYYDELAAKAGITVGSGPEAALAFAKKWVGTKEKPPGSNWGGEITKWIELAGYDSPVPWCGCFVNACIVSAGLPSGAGWIGFTPAIIRHAQAGTGGWKWSSTDGDPGDLALFDTPGGDIAVHVEIVKKKLTVVRFNTFGGNTSNGKAGSQSEGNGVFERTDRSTQGNFRIVGFAKPPYKKAA